MTVPDENRPTEHWHTMMVSHGADRDSVHKYGGIPHAHGRPIDLRDEKHQPRRHLPSEND